MNGTTNGSMLNSSSECEIGASNGSLSLKSSHMSQQCMQKLSQGGPYVPLHERIQKRIADRSPFFSLEFFPPKTLNGVGNFLTRLDRLREGSPMFIDVTWHLGSDPGNLKKETSSMSIAASCLNYCRVDTMLHVTCAQYTREQTLKHLEKSKEMGLRNILALRGDLPNQNENNTVYQFRALDMIRWIKEEYDDYFTIACSGYPTGHPEAPSYAADIRYLKSKVDAGAQFVITQLFFDAAVFEKFVRDCREIGITVPIIPGIMPIQLTIPESILTHLEPIKNDDDAVRSFGIQHAVEMCRHILNSGAATSVHLYTMNREASCREILKALGLWTQTPLRSLPWKSFDGNHPLRAKEDVRPIFWSTRPKAYVFRTRDWDQFPNGRWGNSSSPAFNDLADYYLFYLKGQPTRDDQLRMYGAQLESFEAICKVFVNFITQKPNEQNVKVTRLPWNEQDIDAETSLIKDQLVWCNENGILTVNSQPAVNGAPSTDPQVGWGKPGGYCYQKGYLEFFTSQKNVEILRRILPNYPRLSCTIINHNGSIDWSNADATTPIAITWGVFPGCEIAQPTVVDPLSFRYWKDEAYEAWMNWATIYPDDSSSRKLLTRIHDEFCLVTLVDNDFPKPVIIFDVLAEVLRLAGETNKD
ncbi:unnamed protein product [Anisakis simplex]|uniref:Methylenetetrahydrofolate reductase n=1 Tax=Anisakis simplex TaxID=6269 RepID=A0A0M3K1C7_ANISI|nr:unnamed protein product [Anisakis simplex]